MDRRATMLRPRAWQNARQSKGGDEDRWWRLVQLLASLLTVPIGAFGTYLITTQTDAPVWLILIGVVVPTWVILVLLVAAIRFYLKPSNDA